RFHSVNYWADGRGGYVPYLPEQPISILDLQLQAPQGGQVFDFAQPVFLEVTLSNRSGRTLDLSPQWLDPKSGLLEILIRRRGENESRSFIPVVERCYDLSADTADSVPPGQSISNNLNLTFGAAGFPFAEPGEYQVTALLAFPDRQNQRELVVRSNALRIRVAYPKSREEENDAMILQREDVGLYFALGGSQALPAARDALEEVRARRQGKGERITDPIVANIVRDEGIDTGRPYLRYRDGKFSQQDGDRARAAELLENLKGAALKAFDPHTAEQTKKLAQKHRRAAGK
ncbi:MAG: acetyltransferase, partial [Candidatus Competibacteraceae bacterium]|nr:acetyltransferase [Candidatus Competibacteraceae bacterium]